MHGPQSPSGDDVHIKVESSKSDPRPRYAKLQAFQSFLSWLLGHRRKLGAAAHGQKADKNLLARLKSSPDQMDESKVAVTEKPQEFP
jgi:hypothetical protein